MTPDQKIKLREVLGRLSNAKFNHGHACAIGSDPRPHEKVINKINGEIELIIEGNPGDTKTVE